MVKNIRDESFQKLLEIGIFKNFRDESFQKLLEMRVFPAREMRKKRLEMRDRKRWLEMVKIL